MAICDKCSKNITKTRPGIECSKCDKLVHLTPECSGLSNKQKAALRANESLDWTCDECQENSSRRRSIIIPEDENDDEERELSNKISTTSPEVNKLLKDITLHMEKAMKRELKDLTKSLQFHSDKMDEILENLENFKATTLELKRKNLELTNKNNELETRVGALEQHIQNMEQKKLLTKIEIVNIPEEHGESLSIVQKISTKIKMPPVDIEHVSYQPGFKERPGKLIVNFKSEDMQDKWVTAAKSTTILAQDVLPESLHRDTTERIYIREALTPYNRTLLWNAKQKLKETYKYIWCKKGVIRAKKEDNGPSKVIRTNDDIKKLLK